MKSKPCWPGRQRDIHGKEAGPAPFLVPLKAAQVSTTTCLSEINQFEQLIQHVLMVSPVLSQVAAEVVFATPAAVRQPFPATLCTCSPSAGVW